jgi:hypothetical protein
LRNYDLFCVEYLQGKEIAGSEELKHLNVIMMSKTESIAAKTLHFMNLPLIFSTLNFIIISWIKSSPFYRQKYSHKNPLDAKKNVQKNFQFLAS